MAPRAQGPGSGAPPPVHFDVYGVREGLPEPYVTDLLEDRYGFLWVSTQMGFARFDGTTFRIVRPGDPALRRFLSLSEGPDGGVWASEDLIGGLVKYDRWSGETRSFFPHLGAPRSLGEPEIMRVEALRDGRIAALTSWWTLRAFENARCLDLLDPATGAFTAVGFERPSGWMEGYPCDPLVMHWSEERVLDEGPVLQARDGALWLGAQGALYRVAPDSASLEGPRPLLSRPYPATDLDRLGRLLQEPLVALTQVGDDADHTATFELSRETTILLVGLGELTPTDAYDVGWLEEARGDASQAGDTLWAMDLRRSAWAGGRSRNRLVVDTLTLAPGRYRLRYRSDASWNFGDWFGRPEAAPHRPAWWGVQAVALPPNASGLPALTAPPEPPEAFPWLASALLEGRDGALWVGTMRGELFRREPPATPGQAPGRAPEADRFTRLDFAPPDRYGFDGARVRALHEDGEGDVWVGVDGRGLYRVDPSTGHAQRFLGPDRIDPARWPDADRIRTVLADPDGTVWVGTAGGLVHLDPRTGGFNLYGRTFEVNTPPGVVITKLHLDRRGSLWMGTKFGGLVRLDRSRSAIRVLTHAEGEPKHLPPRRIEGVVEGTDGTVWVGSDRGLMNYGPDRVALITPDFGALAPVLDREVVPLLAEPNGDLWLTDRARRELHRYDPARGALRTYPAPPDGGGAPPLLRSVDGTYFFATNQEGLFRFDPEDGTFYHYPTQRAARSGGLEGTRILPYVADSLSQREIVAFHESDDGRLWIGTDEGGLVLFDPSTETFASYYDPRVPLTSVTAIAERGDGALWLDTELGLGRFDPATGDYAALDLPPGFGVHVFSLVPDARGLLWAPSRHGLQRVDPDRATFRTYGTEYGLHQGIFRAYRLGSGQIISRTRAGLVVLDPDALAPDPRPPRVVLEALTAEGRGGAETLPLLDRGAIGLPHDRNDLALAYVGLDYSAPEAVTYAYHLDGYDEHWQEVGDQQTARYPNVPPGRYTFRVRARNADGYWSDPDQPGASLALVIHPPWWETLWARLLGALTLIGIAVVGAWRFKQRAEARAVELEATVAERTAELRGEKETVTAQAAELVSQAEKLRELDRAKSRFFANVSHELRTPLTLLLGPIRDALSNTHVTISARHVPAMHRSAERLLTLVDELLDLARLDAGRLRLRVAEHDLVALTRRNVLAFASRAEREGLALAFESQREHINAWVDAERYERVVSNLLTNAFKFTPSGGRVRVTLDVEGDVDDGDVVLTVRDTGEGIREDLVPHVFERFRQGDDAATRRHEGAGIGLALVRELVTLHGGTVEAQSEVGFGSTFTVRLPLGSERFDAEAFADAPAEASEIPRTLPEPAEYDEPEGHPIPVVLAAPADATVLVVEDHDDMRAYLRDLLAPHYQVEEAADGEAGLEAARRLVAKGLTPDLVISDVMMPGMDGYALCHALREDDALGHVPVVLLTARADEESKLAGLGEGADDYLSKPFSAEELLARCENLIEVRRRLRARFSGEVIVRPSHRVVESTEVVVAREEADWVEAVRAVCEEHLADANFGVDWLADELGVSTRTLQRRLKAASGLTPGAFLRTLRLERAAELLEAGAGSVAEVGAAVGYTNANWFSRAFRQGFGVPPSAWAEGERP